MLEDVLKSYKDLANLVNWSKLDRNELLKKCVESEGSDLYESYYSALVCKNWGYIKWLKTVLNNDVPDDQCYDILIDILNNTLKSRIWLSEKYKDDPKAPEKAFSVNIKKYLSMKIVSLNRYKRKSNSFIKSIDEMQENYDDFSATMTGLTDFDGIHTNLASFYADRGKLLNSAVIELIYNDIKVKNIVSCVKKLEKNHNILKKYNVSDNDFNNLIDYINSKSNFKLNNEIKGFLREFRLSLEV